jgi:Tfp pilus assembly protein PilF
LAHYFLALSYLNLNKPDDAAKELQATLAITSKSGSAMNQVSIPAQELLGRIYMQKQEWDLARAQFTELLKVSPSDYYAHYALAYLAGRDGRTEEAADHLRRAVEAEPQSAEAHNALGAVYLDQGNIQAAEAEFSKTIELDPKFAWAYYNLGRLHLKTGKNDQAAKEFRKALEIDPRLEPAQEALRHLQPSGQ